MSNPRPKTPSDLDPLVKRDAKGRIVKGSRSLNPTGRPHDEREVIEALRLHGPELVEALLKLALRKKNPSVEAIKVALAYAYGKPREKVELTGADGGPIEWDLSRLTDEQLNVLEQIHSIAKGGADAAEPH